MSMLGALALLMLAPAAVAAPPPADLTRPQLLVAVRQEAHRPLTADVLRRLGAEAQEIWRPYLDIAFQSADGLAPFRGDDTLALVLTERKSGRRQAGLGWIDFVGGEPSRTITVSVGAAEAMLAGGTWSGRSLAAWPPAIGQQFLIRALGRAVAHEIGHYLLGSKVHNVRGLMRARFTIEEIMIEGLGQYRLQPAEVDLLKERANSYALARQAAKAEPS